YLTSPIKVIETIPSSRWLGDIQTFDLPSFILEDLITEISRDLFSNIEHTDLIFRFLRYGYLNQEKWLNEINELLDYIEKNTDLLSKDKQLVSVENTKKKFDWRLITKNALYTLLDIRRTEFEDRINDWIKSDIKELETFVLLEFMPDEIVKLRNFKSLFRIWFNKYQELRRFCIDKMFWISEDVEFNPESILRETQLEEDDYKNWQKHVENSDYSSKKNDKWVSRWLSPEREKLLKWICDEKSLYDTLWKLPISKCDGLLSTISKTHRGPKDSEEVAQILSLLNYDNNPELEEF
ncbi:unnamed protein product, partial [marine sediment metagenome]